MHELKRRIRLFTVKVPVLHRIYVLARRNYRFLRRKKAIQQFFTDYEAYRIANTTRAEGTLEIQTINGLKLLVRRNMDDAYIVTEIFIDKPYVRHVHVGDRPIVVDIGGYIGDFSVYAATYLNARKVFVYEPSPENFAILQQNIKNNNLEDRIEAVNSAVSDVEELFMDTDQERNDPAMVSPGYSAPGANYLRIVSVTLPKLIRTHGIEKIDLLKLDCEGAEYPILLSTPTELFEHIENIVFEYHEVGNFQSLLATVRCRLDDAGYQLKTEPPYVYAYR